MPRAGHFAPVLITREDHPNHSAPSSHVLASATTDTTTTTTDTTTTGTGRPARRGRGPP